MQLHVVRQPLVGYLAGFLLSASFETMDCGGCSLLLAPRDCKPTTTHPPAHPLTQPASTGNSAAHTCEIVHIPLSEPHVHAAGIHGALSFVGLPQAAQTILSGDGFAYDIPSRTKNNQLYVKVICGHAWTCCPAGKRTCRILDTADVVVQKGNHSLPCLHAGALGGGHLHVRSYACSTCLSLPPAIVITPLLWSL